MIGVQIRRTKIKTRKERKRGKEELDSVHLDDKTVTKQ